MKNKLPYKLKYKGKFLCWILGLFFPASKRMDNIYMAFGKIVFVPAGVLRVPQDMLVHELTHLHQQNFNYFKAILWWIRYVFSKRFRYAQELEAYHTQFHFLCKFVRDRNKRVEIKKTFASILSGPLYNNASSFWQAYNDLG